MLAVCLTCIKAKSLVSDLPIDTPFKMYVAFGIIYTILMFTILWIGMTLIDSILWWYYGRQNPKPWWW